MNPFHPFPKPKLTIELVPATQWGDNLRSHLSKGAWDSLRAACYEKAGHKCEICGGVGSSHPVECHEIWDYDDTNKIQKLVGLIALCPGCHHVKHIGRAAATGNLGKALLHIMNVNQWPGELAEEYVIRQFEIHQIRSTWVWTIDLSWLEDLDSYFSEVKQLARQARSKRAQAMLEALKRKR